MLFSEVLVEMSNIELSSINPKANTNTNKQAILNAHTEIYKKHQTDKYSKLSRAISDTQKYPPINPIQLKVLEEKQEAVLDRIRKWDTLTPKQRKEEDPQGYKTAVNQVMGQKEKNAMQTQTSSGGRRKSRTFRKHKRTLRKHKRRTHKRTHRRTHKR